MKHVSNIELARESNQLLLEQPESKLSPTAKKIAEGAATVRQIDPGDEDIAYLHFVMTQVSLPRSKTTARYFERSSGNAKLRIDAGVIDNGGATLKELPLPYGSIPRYMLAYLNTYAIRNKSLEIPLGHSARDFMESIGYTVSGGKRGTYTKFRDQIIALAACRLVMTAGDGKRTPKTHVKGDIVEVFDIWTSLDSRQRLIWPGRIVLDKSYYNSLEGSAVPLNHTALLALRGNALALDIYAWLAHRLHRVNDRNGAFVSWANLKQQFGNEYADDNAGRFNFKKEFLRVLKIVKQLYPAARVQECWEPRKAGKSCGLTLLTSPPPISKLIR
jgi:Plasmid encoded RepA protein